MTIADWCILAAAVLPYLVVAAAKYAGRTEFDNAAPRNPRFYAEGFRARAWGAHLNGFEAFPVFAIGVLLAEFRGAPQGIVDSLALGFIAFRILYTWLYLSNRPALRSGVWTLGFIATMLLFAAAAALRPG